MSKYEYIKKDFLLEQFLLKKSIFDIAKELNISEHSLRNICDKFKIRDFIYHKCKYCGTETNLKYKIVNNITILHDVCCNCSILHINTFKDFSLQKQQEINEKRKQTCQKRYGLNGRPRTQVTTEKIRITKEKRYGNGKYNNLEKQKQTMLDRYGVDHSSKLCTTEKGYSKISQELFWEIYNNLPEDLKQHTYFAELNQEFSCFNKDAGLGYKYDFVITNIKFCIEFQGCYWHANPLVFDINETTIIHNKTVRDIWSHDELKEYYLTEKYGYDLLEVWDNEYLENKQKTIDDMLYAIYWNYRKYILKTINI